MLNRAPAGAVPFRQERDYIDARRDRKENDLDSHQPCILRDPLLATQENLWRRLVMPRKIENWSLTSLQQRLVKTGGRLVKHARYYWLMLAESHLTRRLFGSVVRRIEALAVATG